MKKSLFIFASCLALTLVACGETPSAPSVELLSIAVENAKTTYNVGEEFVKPDVIASYSDETTANVKNDATFSGFDSSNAVTGQIITVTYQTKTTTFTVDIIGEHQKEAVSLELSNKVTDYKVGDLFQKPTVKVVYDDESKEEVTHLASFSGFNLSSPVRR